MVYRIDFFYAILCRKKVISCTNWVSTKGVELVATNVIPDKETYTLTFIKLEIVGASIMHKVDWGYQEKVLSYYLLYYKVNCH